MMKHSSFKLQFVLSFLIAIFAISACNRTPCKNTNPLFDQYIPSAPEYKEELVKQLASADKFECWFNAYLEKSGREYILVDIQGKDLCAKGEIFVDDWRKLECVHKAKGLGYKGSKLKGLKLEIRKDSLTTELAYKDSDRIID